MSDSSSSMQVKPEEKIVSLDSDTSFSSSFTSTLPCVQFEPLNMIDFEIRFRNQQFKVHKLYLVMYSVYFKEAFERKEDNILEVPSNCAIADCSLTSFRYFLDYFYANPSSSIVHDKAKHIDLHQELYKLAYYFDVKTLMELCENRICLALYSDPSSQIRAKNMWILWDFAEHWNMKKLNDYIQDTIANSAASFNYYTQLDAEGFKNYFHLLSIKTRDKVFQHLVKSGDSMLPADKIKQGMQLDYLLTNSSGKREWVPAKCEIGTSSSGVNKYRITLSYRDNNNYFKNHVINIVEEQSNLAKAYTYVPRLIS